MCFPWVFLATVCDHHPTVDLALCRIVEVFKEKSTAMRFSHFTLPSKLCMIMGLLLSGCSKQKEEKAAATTVQNEPSQSLPIIKAPEIPEQQSSQPTDESPKEVALTSIRAALEPLRHGADLLQTIRAGWGRFEHPHFATVATTERIRAALTDPPSEFLKTTRSVELDSSLRTALVGRLSLLTAYLGEGGEGDDKPIRILSVLSDTALHAQATEGDVMSIRMLKCAAQLRSGKSSTPILSFKIGYSLRIRPTWPLGHWL
jgi:hypothetical protein